MTKQKGSKMTRYHESMNAVMKKAEAEFHTRAGEKNKR
jgi:hypothetical protein